MIWGSGGPRVCKCREYETCAVCTAPDQQVFRREYWNVPGYTETPLQEIVRRVSAMTTDELQIVLTFLRGRT
jgi:hypothetical protein